MDGEPSAGEAAPVVAACAILAFTGACFAHEVLGHGGACRISGGFVATMTSSLFACRPGSLLADLGGPCANLLMGLASVVLLRTRPPGTITRLLLVLSAGINLFWLAGCLLQSTATARGDFAYAARLFGSGQGLARTLFGVAGAGIGVMACRWLGRQRVSRATFRLAYIVAGTAACASALCHAPPFGPALREAALESFGGMFWLCLVRPRLVGPEQLAPPGASNLRRLVALALVALGLLLALGHGVDAATA